MLNLIKMQTIREGKEIWLHPFLLKDYYTWDQLFLWSLDQLNCNAGIYINTIMLFIAN